MLYENIGRSMYDFSWMSITFLSYLAQFLENGFTHI